MDKPKIITTHVRPPIPHNGWDWCAQYDDCEGYYAGWGATEESAIADLECRYGDVFNAK